MPIEEIEKMFYNLDIPQEFGGNIDTEDYDWLYDWCDSTVKKHLAIPHSYEHGISKLVFIFPNCDWVVKIPFNGYYTAIWNDEEEKYDNETWNYFKNAMDSWDYCNVELEKYEQLQSLGLECFLAETRYLCSDRDNYPIYIQEKVIPHVNDKKKRTPTKKSLELIKGKYYFNATWVALAIDFYGEEKTFQFLNYIDEIDTDMGEDLHSGNYGYRADGSPCLIDFSGWCEDC